MMNKRDVILSIVDENRSLPYIPAAFFLHFPPEFRGGQAAVDKHLEFFRYTGMDLVKIQYERKYPPLPMQKPQDWAGMPRYGPDFYREQLEAVKGLVEAAHSEAVIVQTLYSPFMCAWHTAGEAFISALDEQPEQVAKGLEIITDSLLEFVRECTRLGVDGFYTSTQGGEAGRFSTPEIFEKYIKPFDLVLMEEVNRTCEFNILHVCDYQRPYADFSAVLDYPGTVVNCPLQFGEQRITPHEAAEMFGRPFMGGLERLGAIARGDRAAIKQAIEEVSGEAPPRFILAADCTVPDNTPWDNLKYAIEVAHSRNRE
jgi:uroporphyrinogen decarboxylase